MVDGHVLYMMSVYVKEPEVVKIFVALHYGVSHNHNFWDVKPQKLLVLIMVIY